MVGNLGRCTKHVAEVNTESRCHGLSEASGHVRGVRGCGPIS